MDGRSTIGVPNAAIALPDIPQCSGAEAQAPSKGSGGVAVCGGHRLIFKRALVDGARVGAREALGAGPRLEGRALVGRGREADGGEGEATALGVDGSRGDGARVGLALAEDVSERLASDRGTPPIGGTGARQRR
jgi:hypothetical protein